MATETDHTKRQSQLTSPHTVIVYSRNQHTEIIHWLLKNLQSAL